MSEAAIVGVGATPYYRRGRSEPQTVLEMAGKAILAATEDAGLAIEDLDGFAYFMGGLDTALLAQTLGVPEVRFTASLTGGGGGSAGSVGLAAAAVTTGMADVVVSVMSLQQSRQRLGAAFLPTRGGAYPSEPTPELDFLLPSGLLAPGHSFALITQRYIHRYGATREQLGEVALAARANARRRPTALRTEALTLDDYLAAPMVADPLCLFDFCLESDGAVAVITTSLERAGGTRHRPVRVLASAHGGAGAWGQAIRGLAMPDGIFATSGHGPVAKQLYGAAGVQPDDVDVALLYDHFTSMVLMQLEDYGFCAPGEAGPFVQDGHIRWPDGGLPVNTHGGNLSEAYIVGMTHVKEAVEQLRGTAVNQVADAEVALVTGGPAQIPVSGLLLGRG